MRSGRWLPGDPGGESGDSRALTYAELKDGVSMTANTLLELGVQEGDRVAVYMPVIPETAVAMLACALIGAAHSVVFGGFSADALTTRIQEADAKVIITSDGGYRHGKPSALPHATVVVDEAAASKLKLADYFRTTTRPNPRGRIVPLRRTP
ncbi:hypothetical protein GCM10010390_52850 [Streptomyces mordarskii]|uniref:AMP-dependent synthetase/ligase domain-containing protein n=1 Tax=Streptomyces mordarskii TaxID=1226758 RepID=A0ABP3NHK8_9ACTN